MVAGVEVLFAIAPIVKLECELVGQVACGASLDEGCDAGVVVLEEDGHLAVVSCHLGGAVHQIPLAGKFAQLLAFEIIFKEDDIAWHEITLGISGFGRLWLGRRSGWCLVACGFLGRFFALLLISLIAIDGFLHLLAYFLLGFVLNLAKNALCACSSGKQAQQCH